MKNQKYYLFIALVLAMTMSLTSFATATCVTTTGTNGTDFMQINQSSYSTIPIAANQKWSDFTYFTPRLNFTHTVYESLVGQMATTNYTLQWLMIASADTFSTVNSTFVLKNGTATIPTSNYTLTSADNHTFKITFQDSRYNGSTLLASWNRTFVKNVDDIFLNATGMTGLASFSTFIQSNSPTDYGSDKEFRPNPATYYGDSINLTNWAVGWETLDTDCTSDCDNHVNTTLLDLIITMFLIGMLVFAVYLIKSGGASTQSIVTMVVAFLIMLVALVILRGIISNVCIV